MDFCEHVCLHMCVCVFQALEEALNLHTPTTQAGMNLGEGVLNLRQQELHTQIAVLKEQVRFERKTREAWKEVPVSVLEVIQHSGYLLFFVLCQRMNSG